MVAGSYAAGLSPPSMRDKLAAADWTDMFLDVADYSQLSYRKKKVSRRYLAGTELDLTNRGMQIQPGVVAGEKIKLFFNQLVDADLGEREIQELTLPLAIVATDFARYEQAADIGRVAAERQLSVLRTLSVDEKTYHAWRHRNTDTRKREIYIDQIVIAPLQRVHPEYVERQIHQQEGYLLNRAQLDQDLVRVYGDGFKP